MTKLERTPRSIVFFPNGNAAVCDQYGDQMPYYQKGNHAQVIKRLKKDGINWRDIPEVLGHPQRPLDMDYVPLAVVNLEVSDDQT